MAQAEEAMAQTQYEKQRYANLLQELAGQLEINLLRQKADMLAAQKAYQEAIQNNDDATRTRLSEPFPRLSRSLRKQFLRQIKLLPDMRSTLQD